MAKRKINLQNINEVKEPGGIDDLVRDMGSSRLGFSPTEQVIYEVDLNRIMPDFLQPRHFLPFDLRQKLSQGDITPEEAMQELVTRAEKGGQLASLILGRSTEGVENEDENVADDDKGLRALSNSIRIVGLRQPINVYSVTKLDTPGESFYQLGEGERRYWAHQLLVLQGYQQFARIRCIIDTLPEDEELIQRRQQAENAARQDLAAIARARSVEQIQNRFRLKMGTRVPGETTIKLPSQRELDAAVGQEVKTFTGRAIGGRMVRNYLRLLKLSPELQDLVEAAQLTEKQLRPVMRLKTETEQRHLITQIINEKLSGRAVLDRIGPATPASSLKRMKRTTIEQRLEKRLFQAAMTVYEIISLGQDSYAVVVESLAGRVLDETTREALLGMRQLIDDLVGSPVNVLSNTHQNIPLTAILPPVDVIQRHLPESYRDKLTDKGQTGDLLIQLLQEWREGNPVVASRLVGFFNTIEKFADQIRAGEFTPILALQKIGDSELSKKYAYQVTDGKTVYWAYLLLNSLGEVTYQSVRSEVLG